MYIIYLLNDQGKGRYRVHAYPNLSIHKSESLWIVPGTVDPRED